MNAPATARQRLIGIGLMAVTVFFFACLDSSAKWLCQHLPVLQVVWARYALAFLLPLPFVNPWTVPGLLATKRPAMQIGRASLILLSTGLNFVALQYLQLAQTISIMFMTPLLVAVIAGPLLGEWIGPRRAIAVGVGFIGVLVITPPGMAGFHPAMLLSFAGAVIYAACNIMTRILTRHDPTTTTLFFVGFVGSVVLTPFVPFVWVWPSDPWVWFGLGVMAISAVLGHWCIIVAHKFAPASILAPFIYTQIFWMIAAGWFLFADVPDHVTLIGAVIVIASGVYLLWRERVVAGETKSAPDPAGSP